jgi:hypothetical protein
VLLVGLVVATTQLQGVDGGPHGGGVLPVGPAAATTKVGGVRVEDVDGWPPRRQCRCQGLPNTLC